ncbi:hypothetical protein C8J25_101850 [Sphingomonas faeni]|uniref:Uncharacterized protein n=1 Tax=Sphingomonas faeni TaxID=185950 RepID=A0A2T5UCV6_9SPHN|nr:hypothetical protein C8J25_101850 [Sphingomonas faeni]
MKPIVIRITHTPDIQRMCDWIDKNLPETSYLSNTFAFGNDEDWVLWKMMFSGSHHHICDRVWVHTETYKNVCASNNAKQAAASATSAAASAVGAMSLAANSISFVVHPQGSTSVKVANQVGWL